MQKTADGATCQPVAGLERPMDRLRRKKPARCGRPGHPLPAQLIVAWCSNRQCRWANAFTLHDGSDEVPEEECPLRCRMCGAGTVAGSVGEMARYHARMPEAGPEVLASILSSQDGREWLARTCVDMGVDMDWVEASRSTDRDLSPPV